MGKKEVKVHIHKGSCSRGEVRESNKKAVAKPEQREAGVQRKAEEAGGKNSGVRME